MTTISWSLHWFTSHFCAILCNILRHHLHVDQKSWLSTSQVEPPWEQVGLWYLAQGQTQMWSSYLSTLHTVVLCHQVSKRVRLHLDITWYQKTWKQRNICNKIHLQTPLKLTTIKAILCLAYWDSREFLCSGKSEDVEHNSLWNSKLSFLILLLLDKTRFPVSSCSQS